MKLQVLLFLPAVLFGVLNKGKLSEISNNNQYVGGRVAFLNSKISCLLNSTSEWRCFVKQAIADAEILEKRVIELKRKENRQELTAAQYRLFRYLNNTLKPNLKSWEKNLEKEKENVFFDIRNFDVPRKKMIVEENIAVLHEEPNCSLEKEDVIPVKFCAESQIKLLTQLQARIDQCDRAVDKDLAMFDQARAEAEEILKRNRNDF